MQPVKFEGEVDLNGKVDMELNLKLEVPKFDPVAITLSILSIIISICTFTILTLR